MIDGYILKTATATCRRVQLTYLTNSRCFSYSHPASKNFSTTITSWLRNTQTYYHTLLASMYTAFMYSNLTFSIVYMTE